ncbi:MAG: cobalt ECF transporter T component CbiQ [Deltaproteobacteria bacterium]|jgi:cobalt/nickel transport system permease protein|nr:cobalt ECF transporter T component CbiQ [Deltaproteobacteria bacterium]
MSYSSELSGSGALSRVDPRLKVIILVVWSVIIALSWDLRALAAGLLGSIILVVLAGCDQKAKFIKRLFLINSFLIFVWLVVPFSFSVPGQTLLAIGPLKMTNEGFRLTFILTVKALEITAGAMAMTVSTSTFDLMAAARAMGAPEKLTAMTALMIRYIRVVGEEFERLVWAMRIRGFVPKLTIHCLRSYANLAGILLVRGLDRGERVHAAMLCRGYKGRFFFDRQYQLRALDGYVALVFFILSALVVILDVI